MSLHTKEYAFRICLISHSIEEDAFPYAFVYLYLFFCSLKKLSRIGFYWFFFFCLTYRISKDSEKVRQENRCSYTTTIHSKGSARTVLHDGPTQHVCERVRGDARPPLPV